MAPSAPEHEPSGPGLRILLSTVAVLVVVLGFVAYWRYTVSENHFAVTLADMDERGRELDVEGCVDAVLQWHGRCEANKPLCDNGIPQVMTHCLMARPRTGLCESIELGSAKAQWVFQSCRDRGTPCGVHGKCPCADTYRTIDSYCRHGGDGVVL